jgi:hypothetical protein
MDGMQGHMQGSPSQGAGDQPFERRAGSYQKQLRGYRAFIPARLPPEPPIQLTGEFQRLLSQADLALGRLDGSIHHQAQTVDIRRLSLDELPPDIYIVL